MVAENGRQRGSPFSDWEQKENELKDWPLFFRKRKTSEGVTDFTGCFSLRKVSPYVKLLGRWRVTGCS